VCTKLLAIFYTDISSQKGDAVWAIETLQEMSNFFEIELVAIKAGNIIGVKKIYSIPFFRKGMAFFWNSLALLFGLTSFLRFNPDVIYSDCTAGSIIPAILSILSGKPLVVEVHGPVGSQDVALYRSHLRIRLVVAQWMERILLRRARIIIAAPGWSALVQKNYPKTNRIVTVPLGNNRTLFHPMDPIFCRQELGLPMTAPIAVFVGNISPWQGLDTLIAAAPLVVSNHPQVLFLIVGDGSERLRLIQKVKEMHLDQAFRFTGPVSYEEVATYIAAANVGLSIFSGNRGQKGGISALKTLNYLSCGRPAIVNEMDEMTSMVIKYGAGMAIPPDDGKALSRALTWLFNQPDGGTLVNQQATELAALIPSWKDRIAIITKSIMALLGAPEFTK
jgi:glycosyltransferase involved in cell wall biosynthesis